MDFIKLKVQPPVEDGSLSPIQSFLQLERYNGIQLVHLIHENLAALSKVIRGISLITNEIQEYAKDLLQNEVSTLLFIREECRLKKKNRIGALLMRLDIARLMLNKRNSIRSIIRKKTNYFSKKPICIDEKKNNND